MSDTPRTDKKQDDAFWVDQSASVFRSSFSFARELERELNAANERIKQLEEAGDRMAKVLGPPGCELWAETEEVDASYEAWIKSKEAKP